MAAAKSKRTKKRRGAAKSKPSVGQQQLFRRGGKRRGAGRKSKKARPGRRHARRADFSARHPLHVVLRVDDAVRTLRRRAMYAAIRAATTTAARWQRIRIIHISLQRTHIHMIVEAADREALARGMQGFQIAAAKYINRALGRELGLGCARRGSVFTERYYVESITTPTQALRALTYVLSNWRRHGEDRGAARAWMIDPFSTGAQFPHWAEIANGGVMPPPQSAAERLVVCTPTTWLLTEGWKRVGSISAWTVPGPKGRS